MARLDSQGNVISSGPGTNGLRIAWQSFADWLGIGLPSLYARLRRLIG